MLPMVSPPLRVTSRRHDADVDVLVQEPHRAVAEQGVHAAGVEAVDLARAVDVVERVRIGAEHLAVGRR